MSVGSIGQTSGVAGAAHVRERHTTIAHEKRAQQPTEQVKEIQQGTDKTKRMDLLA